MKGRFYTYVYRNIPVHRLVINTYSCMCVLCIESTICILGTSPFSHKQTNKCRWICLLERPHTGQPLKMPCSWRISSWVRKDLMLREGMKGLE